ncbi:hypothetical protein IG631_01121 [Alternaria alternata]|nr:hypothetical protein IG631_01121 [Alternaria alternata]
MMRSLSIHYGSSIASSTLKIEVTATSVAGPMQYVLQTLENPAYIAHADSKMSSATGGGHAFRPMETAICSPGLPIEELLKTTARLT